MRPFYARQPPCSGRSCAAEAMTCGGGGAVWVRLTKWPFAACSPAMVRRERGGQTVRAAVAAMAEPDGAPAIGSTLQHRCDGERRNVFPCLVAWVAAWVKVAKNEFHQLIQWSQEDTLSAR